MWNALMLLADGSGSTPDEGKGGAPGWSGLLPFLAIPILFWFLLMRPMRRQEAQRNALIGSLKKNDKVVTTSGLIGWVVSVAEKEDEVVVRLDDNVKVRMLKSAIAQNLSAQTPKTETGIQEKKTETGVQEKK
jgi:preprotein translocase subunit YajC